MFESCQFACKSWQFTSPLKGSLHLFFLGSELTDSVLSFTPTKNWADRNINKLVLLSRNPSLAGDYGSLILPIRRLWRRSR
jgi:hypothetical protein